MDAFREGLIVGSALTIVLISCGKFIFSLLKNKDVEPIMYKTTIPSGGPAYAKKISSKRVPRAITEELEWQREQEKENG